MNALGSALGHVLRDFALVVREHQVHSAAVNVELGAEVFLAHDRALQMPAGEAFSPWGRPVHDVLRLGLLPEGEVVGSLLVALSVEAAGAFEGGVKGAAAQDSVVMVGIVFLHVEVDAAVALVCIARCQYLLHRLYLLHYVAGGTRLDGGRSHVQLAHGFLIAESVVLHHLHGLQLLEAGLLRYLVFAFVGIVLQMAYVGDVAHIADLVAKVPEQLEQHVVGDPGTGVSQMGVAIDGGTADIHAHMAFVYGFEELLFAAQGVGEIKTMHFSWMEFLLPPPQRLR